MATTELTIRQLADEGGTAPIAPVTVTDAVLKGDGTTLTEELTALNNDLTNKVIYEDYTVTTGEALYQEMYYGDFSYGKSGYNLLSLTNLGSTSNRPSYIQATTSVKARVYSTVASTTVTVRAVYIKN